MSYIISFDNLTSNLQFRENLQELSQILLKKLTTLHIFRKRRFLKIATAIKKHRLPTY